MDNDKTKVRCTECKKVLFEGTEQEAKGLILFCISCAEKANSKTGDCPRRLPAVRMDNGKTYFVDERLKQLRNVNNSHDYIDF